MMIGIMAWVVECVGWASLALGAFFLFSSAIGLFRMPDFFTRLHPAGMADAAAIPLIGLGLLLHVGFTIVAFKIFLLFTFALITAATACHALAKAALHQNMKPLGSIELKQLEKRKKAKK